MRTAKGNFDFVRALTRLSCSDKSTSCGLSLDVLRPRRASSGVITRGIGCNRSNFIDGHSVFLSNNLRFYSFKSYEAKNVMNFYEFEEVENKQKKTFVQMIHLYERKFPNRKGVVDFIHAALKNMKDFGVHEDLETYKKLINLMPKGKYVAKNIMQVGGFHYPSEQYCILDLLCQMELYGVMPDVEMNDLIISIFGPHALPAKKFYRMMYWMPKLKNLSPWLLPKQLPKESFTLAKMAIERITSVDPQTEISSYRTEDVKDSIDSTWIVSGQSPTQRRLLQKHDRLKPVIVEGGDHVWLRNERINYFVLKSEDVPFVWNGPEDKGDVSNLQVKYFNPNYVDEEEEKTVHEQEDGIIYAVCATGTSSKDSLLSWIRLLEKNGNPALENLAVLFRFKTPQRKLVPYSDALTTENEHEIKA